MPTSKKIETTALIGLVVQCIYVGMTWLLYLKTAAPGEDQSLAVAAQGWYLIPGILMWTVVFLHGRQRRLVREEREEMDELKRRRLSEELFEDQELDRLRAHNALMVFERFLVPAISVVLSAVLVFLAGRQIWLARTVGAVPKAQDSLVVGITMAFLAFLGFLVGRYAVGLSRNPEMRLLRAAGSYLLGNVLGSVVLAFAMAMAHFGIEWPEEATAYFIPGVMGLVGLEIVLNMILDIYRPRVPGQESRPPYDSRLLALIAEPGNVLKTVAATLDYQFGFKVSETWFYRFMARAIIPLVVIQLAALWLLTCVMVVDPQEIAFVERFGRPRLNSDDAGRGLKATIYHPGYYLKAPWPIDIIRCVPAYRLYGVQLGKIFYEGQRPVRPADREIEAARDENVILWSEYHINPAEGYEPNFLVPSTAELAAEEVRAPATNFAKLSARIYFRVKTKDGGDEVDERAAYDFYYGYAEMRGRDGGRTSSVPKLVEHVGYAVMCRIAACQDFIRWINVEREVVSARFAAILQQELDNHNAGVQVVYAGIPSVHPPAEVAEAFEGVIKAYQEKEAALHGADRTAAETVSRAKGHAAAIVNRAKGYSESIVQVAQPAAERFKVQLAAYRAAPDVYRYRKYFGAMEQLLKGNRLYIVPNNKNGVMVFDLQDKLGVDIGSIDLEEALEP